MVDITNARNETNEMFKELTPIVKEIADKYSKNLDDIVHKIANANSLTNEDLRDYMLQLSIETYLFSVSKDASALRQDCATTLMKEAQALSYNTAEGTQQTRTNQSLLETRDKQVVNMLFGAVADLMKSRNDEAHRLVATLNSILISRNAEAKLAKADSNEDTNGKTILNESPY